jgi:hypothetical protein
MHIWFRQACRTTLKDIEHVYRRWPSRIHQQMQSKLTRLNDQIVRQTRVTKQTPRIGSRIDEKFCPHNVDKLIVDRNVTDRTEKTTTPNQEIIGIITSFEYEVISTGQVNILDTTGCKERQAET